MPDLALIYKDGIFDLDFAGTVTDEGLRTAVIISLFSDRRANDADVLPDGTNDRRGWWGDVCPEVEGDLIGSRLWLLSRAKQTKANLRLAETYAREGLQWMLDDGEITYLAVTASYPYTGVLLLSLRLRDRSGQEYDYTAAVSGTGTVVRFYPSDLSIDDESGSALTDQSGSVIMNNPLGRI